MAALFYFFRWLKVESYTNIFIFICAGCLSLLANFTSIDFLMPLLGIAVLAHYERHRGDQSALRWSKLVACMAIPVLLTAALIYKPILWLRESDEFKWGPQAFWETWRVLVEKFTHSSLIHTSWPQALIVTAATVFFLLMCYSIFRRFRVSGPRSNPMLFYAVALTGAAMLFTVAQFYLVGTSYLIGRTAVLFYPLLSSVVVLYLVDRQQEGKPVRYGWIALTAGLFVNFCSSANIQYSREWPYDEHTKEVAIFVNAQGMPDRKIRYGVSWMYCPTTLFYQTTLPLGNIEMVEYDLSHDDVRWVSEKSFDFIYLPEQYPVLPENRYELVHRYPNGGVLMKRR
jgi:hypothetical protein